jgi:hypothetical protein
MKTRCRIGLRYFLAIAVVIVCACQEESASFNGESMPVDCQTPNNRDLELFQRADKQIYSYFDKSDYVSASVCIERLIEAGFENPGYVQLLAESYYRSGRCDQAEGAMNRYVELLEEAMGQGALTSGEWENPVLEDMRIGLEQCRSSN